MHNTSQIEPPDDDQISMIDLDPGDKKHNKLAQLLHRYLRFFLQTKRTILSGAIIGATLLLLFTIFAPYLVPKPANRPAVRQPTVAVQPRAVEISYTANKVIYINTADGSVNALQASSGKRLWHYRPALPASRPLNIVGDTVYFTAQNAQKSFVYALRTSDGRLLWRSPLPDMQTSLVTVTEDALYFLKPDGQIYTLKAQDGTLLWQYKEKLSSSHVWLTVLDSIVYLTNPDRMSLSALQASTGKFLWSKQGTGNIWILETTPDIAYIQLNDTTVYAIKTSNGTQLWKYDEVGQEGSFVIEQNIIYLTTRTGAVVALKANDGSLLWQYKKAYPIWGSLVVTSQVLYLNALDGSIYALRAADGRLLWQYKLNNDPSAVFTPPISGQVYMGNTEQVYVTNNNGFTNVLQASTGNLLWHYTTGRILPISSDNNDSLIQPAIYMILQDNTFVALRLQDGALLWHYNRAIQEPPLLEQGVMYVGTQDGTINALNADTGSLHWHVALAN
jgi:outer membrane protein assembly factor BamB